MLKTLGFSEKGFLWCFSFLSCDFCFGESCDFRALAFDVLGCFFCLGLAFGLINADRCYGRIATCYVDAMLKLLSRIGGYGRNGGSCRARVQARLALGFIRRETDRGIKEAKMESQTAESQRARVSPGFESFPRRPMFCAASGILLSSKSMPLTVERRMLF